MNRSKKMLKNTFIITIGKVCTQLITFLLLPLYTSVLSTEEYGTVDLLNTIVTLLIPIVTFQIEQAVFRELIEARDSLSKEKKIISTSIFTVIIQCVIYSLIFFIAYKYLSNRYKLYLFINVITAIFSSLFLQISRGLGDNKKYAVGSFISAASTIILNVTFLVIIKLRVDGMLLATMLGQIISCIYLFLSLGMKKYISIKSFSKKMGISLLKYSIPLIPNQISWWIFNVSDRVIVSYILGVGKNGILSAASKFSSVYIMAFSIFNMSITETIVAHIKDNDIQDYFNKVFNAVTMLFLSSCILLISCMPIVYPILINSKFREGLNLVPILLVSSYFNIIVSLIGIIYIAHKNTKAVANTSIFSALINIVSHLILIKYIGLYAATISTFLSFFTMTLYRLYDMRKKYFAIRLEKLKMTIGMLLLGIVTIIFYMNIPILNIVLPFVTFIMVVIINKKTVLKLIDMIKNRKVSVKGN